SDEVTEDARRVLLEELLCLRQRLAVPEAEGQAEALVIEAVATVHVGLQVLRVHLVRLDPIPILDERLERLRGGALFEESDRQDGAELASARRMELADGHLGDGPGRAEEFRGGLRPSGADADGGGRATWWSHRTSRGRHRRLRNEDSRGRPCRNRGSACGGPAR